jgi:FkbM family methyltransferase
MYNTRLDGLEVMSPADAAERLGQSAVFVVTIWNHGQSFAAIRTALRQLGCQCVLPVQTLYEKHAQTFLPYYTIDRSEIILQEAARVREAFDLWVDDESRREYLDLLRWALDATFPDALARPVEEQCFPPELCPLRADGVFVDGGAFDGDTVETYVRLTGGQFDRIVAYEPSPENFAKLTRRLSELPASVSARIDAHRHGLGEAQGRRFFANAGAASTIAPEGTAGSVDVSIVPLDSLPAHITPSYIKLDIEGMELEALAGMRAIIGRCQPILAICTYHRLSHLWEVPLAIQGMSDRYRLFLRRYAATPWDTVCYAQPATVENEGGYACP